MVRRELKEKRKFPGYQVYKYSKSGIPNLFGIPGILGYLL